MVVQKNVSIGDLEYEEEPELSILLALISMDFIENAKMCLESRIESIRAYGAVKTYLKALGRGEK
jgi:hypothetical protein